MTATAREFVGGFWHREWIVMDSASHAIILPNVKSPRGHLERVGVHGIALIVNKHSVFSLVNSLYEWDEVEDEMVCIYEGSMDDCRKRFPDEARKDGAD